MHSYAVVLLVIIVVAFCKASTDAAESASTDQPPMSRKDANSSTKLSPITPSLSKQQSGTVNKDNTKFRQGIIRSRNKDPKTPFYAQDRSGLIATVAREKIGSPSLGDSTKFMASLL
uniref:RxLR effector protein n=1 Tax=Ascaris lumbricoides TaxID=6252 RepID=A0A0M3I899_ASCLU